MWAVKLRVEGVAHSQSLSGVCERTCMCVQEGTVAEVLDG